jgi:hypothetical protein
MDWSRRARSTPYRVSSLVSRGLQTGHVPPRQNGGVDAEAIAQRNAAEQIVADEGELSHGGSLKVSTQPSTPKCVDVAANTDCHRCPMDGTYQANLKRRHVD